MELNRLHSPPSSPCSNTSYPLPISFAFLSLPLLSVRVLLPGFWPILFPLDPKLPNPSRGRLVITDLCVSTS